MLPKSKYRFIPSLLFIFTFAFFAGTFAAHLRSTPPHSLKRFFSIFQSPFREEAIETASEGNWGLSFPDEGQPPIGNAAAADLREQDAYYIGSGDEKVIYLTFDAGYENGNTPAILEALKKHKAPATFFTVGTFLKENPDLIRRIVSEGHTIGNHTYHHKDMSQLSTKEAFAEEIRSVEQLYEEITGKPMTRYYRPPQGRYSQTNLRMAKEMGYKTFFWSLAYVDWYEKNQPTREAAFNKLLPRIHPGAIVLLHSTSKTNAEILDELLTKWEELGYSFKDLSEIK